jgi:hypothetical protein
MDWFAAMLTRANGAAGVTSAIGAANKVYPENAPQNTARPYVTLLDLTAGRPQHLKGFDLEPSRVQVDVWANSYKQKNAIMEALLTALVPGGTFSGHKFQRADVALGPRDLPERDGDTIIYRKSADLIIHHTPA